MNDTIHTTDFDLSTSDALLALLVDHLADEINGLRYALAWCLHQLGAPEVSPQLLATLYPDDPAGFGRNVTAKRPPFPPYVLARMARGGKSLSQAAGSRATAEALIAEAFAQPPIAG